MSVALCARPRDFREPQKVLGRKEVTGTSSKIMRSFRSITSRCKVQKRKSTETQEFSEPIKKVPNCTPSPVFRTFRGGVCAWSRLEPLAMVVGGMLDQRAFPARTPPPQRARGSNDSSNERHGFAVRPSLLKYVAFPPQTPPSRVVWSDFAWTQVLLLAD